MNRTFLNIVIIVWITISFVDYISSAKKKPLLRYVAIFSHFIFGEIAMIENFGFPDGVLPGIFVGFIGWGILSFGKYNMRRHQKNAAVKAKKLFIYLDKKKNKN